MIKFESGLKEEFGINTAEAVVRAIKIESSGTEFKNYKNEKFNEIRKNYGLETLKDNEIIRRYRDFYWRIGIDPTKIRPSSEALIRRVLGGKDIPEINNCVDSYNLASILTFISMGAYDLEKINGGLTIRHSKEEKFRGIGGRTTETNGEIVISDDEKIIGIYPYRDSELTMVTEGTRDIVIVLCGVKGISPDYMKNSAKTTVELVTRFCGGRGEESWEI